ncbi:flavodoxin family protein [Desulfosediminicola ganghwensis]|uniref:flavodoxin family protein n=1 Tax=Desulfosediminicola ganghwensis TaxID=2569540 RepID=UPI0010AC1B9E|nr:flavodoxin family protein [Desulfosediminicola ganghwensis]
MNSIHAMLKELSTSTPPDNKILGIGGSPRRNGNSDILLKNALKGSSRQGVQSESYQLRDIQFQGCIGCEMCRKDKICTGLLDGMSMLYQPLLSSKGLVLACPTHNYNITAWMKAFIDRLYCLYNFQDTIPRAWSSNLAEQNRKAVIVAICEQENKKDMGFTLEAMRMPLQALGYEIVDEIAIFRIFHRGKVKNDQEQLDKVIQAGENLAKAITLTP